MRLRSASVDEIYLEAHLLWSERRLPLWVWLVARMVYRSALQILRMVVR